MVDEHFYNRGNKVVIFAFVLLTKSGLNSLASRLRQDYLFYKADLQGCSFRNNNLSGVNLSHADIRGADFTNGTLTGTNFSRAQAGLQRNWILGLIILSLILGIVAGFISGYVGGFAGSVLVSEGIFAVPFWSSIVAIFILATFTLITIRQGLGGSLGTLAIITALAAILLAAASRGEKGIENAVIFLLTQSLLIGGAVAGVMIGALVTALSRIVLKNNLFIIIDIIPVIIAIPGIIQGLKGLGEISNPLLNIAGVIAVLVAVLVIAVAQIVGFHSAAGDPKYHLIRTLAIIISTFRGTKFINANLTDADFTEAVLENTDFRRAVLKRTCFYHVKELDKARCQGTYLENTQVQQLVVNKEGQGYPLEALDLKGVNLDKANLEGAKLRKVNLSEATLKEATLQGVDLTESNCVSIDLTNANLKKANLTGSNLMLAHLKNADFQQASLIGANLTSANLEAANLSMAKLVRAQLYRANLNNSCLTAAYIQDWAISTDTQFNYIKCDFIYMRLPSEDDPDQDTCRKPDNRSEIFKKGDFADFIAPIIKTLDLYRHQNIDPRTITQNLKTLDLYHHEGIDPSAAALALIQLAEKYPEANLEIVALEGRGRDKIRLQAQVGGEVDRSQLSEDYFSSYNSIADLPYSDLKALLAGIAEKDERIRSLEGMVMTAIQSDKAYIETYYNLGDTVSEKSSINIQAGGDMGNVSGIAGGDVSGVLNIGTISGSVTNAINQLPDQPSAEQPCLKELLTQLQVLIETEAELSGEDKTEALEQVKTLAEAGQKPEDSTLQKAAKTAMKILKGTISGLSETTKLVLEGTSLLKAITALLALV